MTVSQHPYDFSRGYGYITLLARFNITIWSILMSMKSHSEKASPMRTYCSWGFIVFYTHTHTIQHYYYQSSLIVIILRGQPTIWRLCTFPPHIYHMEWPSGEIKGSVSYPGNRGAGDQTTDCQVSGWPTLWLRRPPKKWGTHNQQHPFSSSITCEVGWWKKTVITPHKANPLSAAQGSPFTVTAPERFPPRPHPTPPPNTHNSSFT